MIPIRVSAENVASYPSLTLDIPEGLTSLLGRNELSDGADSNGAGKSTLLEMIRVGLFGDLRDYLTVGEEKCSLTLEFEASGSTYRVRRTFTVKGRGKTTLDLEKLEERGDKWEPLTAESTAETQRLLTRIVGLSEETFAHSVYAKQGAQHFADPSLAPRDRKQILAEALALGQWDVLLELVRTDIRSAETEIAALTLRIGDLEAEQESEESLQSQAAGAVTEVGVTTARLKDCEENHENARKHLAEAEQAAKEREGLQRDLDRLVARAAEADTARSEAATLAAGLDMLAEQAAGLEALEADLRVREAADAARVAVEQNRRQALTNIAQLRRLAQTSRDLGLAFTVRGKEAKARRDELAEKGAGVCSECGQPLQGGALEVALASLDAELQILRDQLAAATKDAAEKEAEAVAAEQALPPEPEPALDLGPLRHQVATAHEAAVSLATNRERLAGLERLALLDESFQGEMDAAKVALAAAEGVDPEHLLGLQHQVRVTETALYDARQNLTDAQQEQTRCEERLRSLAAAAVKAQEATQARERLNTRLDLLKALEAAYGRNGIPALILETSAIPQIEAEAQRILSELGVPYRVELVTQRETKTGTLKDTLDVVVHEPAGPRRYETYSGGEQTRLEFALRIALARLVASRSGSEQGILALDELQFLDSAGMAQVANVLRGLSEFRSIMVVSHDDRLSDSFDQQLLVVRDEDGSHLQEVAA